MAMATSIQTRILPFSLLILHLVALFAEPTSLFSRQGFNNADLGLDFSLLGDAELDDGISCVNLTAHRAFSSGDFVFKKPLKLIDTKSRQPVSFSSDFVFSMSSSDGEGNGDGLALVIAPVGDPLQVFGEGPFGVTRDFDKMDGKFVAVEFDTRKDDEVEDVSGNHVGVDVGSFVSREVSDVSSLGIVLNGGEKLRSWVDYEASSKMLEIRLSKVDSERPYDPLISYSLDLLELWGKSEVLMGISSSSGGSKQTCSVCSWSLRVRTVPNSLHSQPMDPRAHGDGKKSKNCALKILGGVIFATGCGTLVAFFMLLLWVVLFSSSFPVAPEIPMKNLDFRYEKIDVNGEEHHQMEPRVSV